MQPRANIGPARSNINITPYIDILLVLLIIFMVLQPLQQFDLEARVPERPAEPSAPPAPAIVLSVDADYRMEINGEPVLHLYIELNNQEEVDTEKVTMRIHSALKKLDTPYAELEA